MFCSNPFTHAELYQNGDVYFCCPAFTNYFVIGNIYRNSFENIWNGVNAKKLRSKILKGDFSMCEEICEKRCNIYDINPGYNETVNEYPSYVTASIDNACNVMCTICRDEKYHVKYTKELAEKEIDELWLPIFKNAKTIRFGCSGESFASYKEAMLIKKTAEKYPDVRFHIHTNGILGNEKLLRELNIYDRIEHISVSIHAASKNTYKKIVRGGDFDKVLKNLELYSKMKHEHKINDFRMVFCVYTDNYKEMPEFAKMAAKYNSKAVFWGLRVTARTKLGDNFDEYSVTNPNNKYHQDFLEVLKNPVFKELSDCIEIYPDIKKYMP